MSVLSPSVEIGTDGQRRAALNHRPTLTHKRNRMLVFSPTTMFAVALCNDLCAALLASRMDRRPSSVPQLVSAGHLSPRMSLASKHPDLWFDDGNVILEVRPFPLSRGVFSRTERSVLGRPRVVQGAQVHFVP